MFVIVKFDKESGCPVDRTSFTIYEEAMTYYGNAQHEAQGEGVGVHFCIED
jgi:hypothetical protein